MQDLTQPLSNNEPISPFGDDVFSPQSPIPGTPQIHQKQMNHLVQAIGKMVANAESSNPAQTHGELITISSPIAGYGKTHLIHRISKTMLNSVSPIELSFGTTLVWKDLLIQTLQSLDSTGSQKSITNSLLDEAAAWYLSNLIGTAVAQGVIEEKECPVSLTDLQADPCRVFSEGTKPKLQVWLKKKLPMLRSSVKLSSTKFAGFTKEDVATWSEYFLEHFRGGKSGYGELEKLTDTESKKRFLQLLRIASNCHPLLIIADHLDHCHGSDTAGMEIATALSSIVEGVSNCVLIVSLNKDLWESVFANKLPSALIDRLNRENLELAPVSEDQAKEMIVNRLCSCGVTHHQAHQFASVVADTCDWAEADALFPRKIIRAAREIWSERSSEFYQPAAPREIPAAEMESPHQIAEVDPVFSLPTPEQQPPLYGAPQQQPVNPFESHSMVYSDRPAPVAPVPVPAEDATYRNQTPAAPVQQQEQVQPFPQPTQNYQDQPLPQQKETSFPVNGRSLNGKTNGQTPALPQQNAQPVTEKKPEPAASPLEVYFSQLVDHYETKSGQLDIQFPSLEMFIKTIGEKHAPLTQSEVSIPGGQSGCLKWALANYTVLIGFEPAQNIYFYNNMLQKLLSDPASTPGKIVCFAHASHPYRHELLTGNGISGDLLQRYFDFIQLSDGELVLIHSASQFLRETTEKGYQAEAVKFLIKKLNPLWQRLCQPLDQSAT